MNVNERTLFKEMTKINSEVLNEDLLQYASPSVLGLLFYNRVQGIAYSKLKKHKALSKVNREFRNSLKVAYEKNIERNESFYRCVEYLSRILDEVDLSAAMLKGAVLCNEYPKGCRTSNDIDLLVAPSDISALGNALINKGFRQGSIINDEFVLASRKEIIESKMLRGETVPYIKKVDLPSMKYLEVDVNFSLDYKNSENDIVFRMLESTEPILVNGIRINSLCKEHFFIHLCAHLYKEATTVPWIKMKRDMTLYKYVDIYILLCKMSAADISRVFRCAEKLNLEKVCAYCILETADLFELKNDAVTAEALKVLATDPDFRLTVFDPSLKKSYIYKTENTAARFFNENRIKDLREI